MTPGELIVELTDAKEPVRSLDGMIAELLGWKRTTESIKLENGMTSLKSVWINPDTNTVTRVPTYTSSIDDARELATQIMPEGTAGITWQAEKCTAQIGNGPVFPAATPALALCVAIVYEVLKRR